MHNMAAARSGGTHDPKPGSAHVRCCEGAVHFHGAQPLDLGWGCGYHNMQMMLSHLLQHPVRPRLTWRRAPSLHPGAVTVAACCVVPSWTVLHMCRV